MKYLFFKCSYFFRCIYLTLIIFITIVSFSFSQSRIKYNEQNLFLSGSNLAWVNFANDIGPGYTDYNRFSDIMLQIHDHGGNAMRWWLHTNGAVTPEFNDSNFVISPGEGTIEDLKTVLDLAWEREIGIDLCLWSFDMLRSSNDPEVLDRNILLLMDTTYTMSYINNCLIPMVDSLKGHPGILTYEIFNEPEGMSNEFGWADVQHVPMSAIQRFVNLCAGAIHRTDSAAQVTSGVWSFIALTDVPSASINKISKLNSLQVEQMKNSFNQKHRLSFSTEEFSSYIKKISRIQNYNYYSDERLIEAGGDTSGTLDFFSVHYYTGLGSQVSPFINSASYWNLNKPIVIAEFAMQTNDSVQKEDLFKRLYQSGYAGALPWSWTDVNFSSHEDMLAGMQFMWDNYKNDVDVNGISGEWPYVTITSPDTNVVFPDSTQITITAEAYDNDGEIISVKFFVNDTLKIGEKDTIPYSITWENIQAGVYTLTAVAVDNQGHERVSNRVPIHVGTLKMTRLEAESASYQGTMTVRNDPLASGGSFLDMPTQNGTVTWTIPSVPENGNYEISFGYKLFYDTPKEQYINVNGFRVDTIRFEGNTSIWNEISTNINLNEGSNTIQMQLFWGWMYLDYLSVPSDLVTSVNNLLEIPLSYSLQQNFPNPFNPSTEIRFSIPKSGMVNLAVFNILGQKTITLINEFMNAGSHSVKFSADNFASGVYFYRLEAGDFISNKKMILLK